ncbi:ParB/RepB/Spo0J family partition protein [Tissierella pigra]|uniref:ParB/RepB/Spo0J family partition protein n=1 Tax=Tissierella pigra TaxID=2607614 RepID=A0A6N7Y2G0_9FIRM|nr:ParB/RepB/Spo0J family partition protein [Tissierella pigra]MBU5428392.1 ParB/RepB/Spo0J family partition protein [Tissierella pigra]MSU02648.1 ParB/RepB/Spo0J family partition protein [Tissierella pigra]
MSVKKRGLGKGLSALISDEVIIDNKKQHKEIIENIDIKLVNPNENQPRKEFGEEALLDLTNSIKIHGLIQPIIVRKVKDKYEIIAGERRWRASKAAGLKEIPCIIKDVDEEVSAKFALIENIQREDLNPIEEAIAYKQLMKKYHLTQEEVASQVGKSRSYIANTLRLLNLENKIIEHISKGELTSGHGKALLGIKDKKKQLLVAEEIIKNNLNVRDVESIANKKKDFTRKSIISNKDPNIINLEEELMERLGTKVNLTEGDKKGKIEIEYYGYEDLERIIDILTK